MAVKRRNTDRVWPDFLDYFRQDFRREVRGWAKVIMYFGLYLPLAILVLTALVVSMDPIPPKTSHLATGQKGSSYSLLAEKFAEYFARHGVTLELVETPGLVKGLEDVRDDASKVNASFLMAGSAKPGQYPDLVSLGSLKYSPVWVFHRGAAPVGDNPLVELLRRRIAVGMHGTTTRRMLEDLLSLHGVALEARPNFFEGTHEEAAERFARGELDAVFIVDGIDSPTVRRLLAVPDRKLLEFDLVDAYVKKLPFLEKVRMPRGSADLVTVYPPKDLTLLASTVTLVVEKGTHPAIQWLFLRAAESISRDRTEFFSKNDDFPKYIDRNVALSEVGERYFAGGLPVVFKYLSNTLATLVDGTWAVLLAVFAVFLPLFGWVLSLREYPANKILYDYWQDLRDLEHDLDCIETEADAQLIVDQLDEMLADVLETWVDDSLIHRYYGLRRTIGEIRELATGRIEVLRAAAPGVA